MSADVSAVQRGSHLPRAVTLRVVGVVSVTCELGQRSAAISKAKTHDGGMMMAARGQEGAVSEKKAMRDAVQ